MVLATAKPNRLIHESSPYLLQHAHNPVDWYAWSPEAFAAARAQNKPIFLSVGYSTCYWCHVMERESFENAIVAREMNERFINIKVDREERPDVDQLYMTAVQVLTHQGGWPMSVFLLPDLRPFYGGTYFPPTDEFGRPGFVTVLRSIADAYHHRKSDVEQSATQLKSLLEQLAEPEPAEHAIRIDQDFIDRMIERSTSDFDPVNGGFGGAPKFPRETVLEMLLRTLPLPPGEGGGEGARNQRADLPEENPLTLHPQADSRSRRERGQMLRKTLDAMANGGIHDQLGGGFHRYSTDAKWLVPHFEIMLYDNAMLAWIYAEAAQQLDTAHVAHGVLRFVQQEMTSPDDAFYTALDAEVDAKEGGSYPWTSDEIEQALGREDAQRFNRLFGLDRGPNFADPHHGSGAPDANVLYLPNGALSQADREWMATRDIRARLLAVRKKRKQPLLDTKIITSWNALMIRAFAHAGKVLNQPDYTGAAERAADFLLAHHRKPDGTLYRTSRDGVAGHDAFLDDYAYLAQALLELGRRDDAVAIVDVMIKRFGDPRGGLFFSAAGADDLIVRQMVGSDSPLPAGAAVAADVLLQLGRQDECRRIIERFAPQFERAAEGMSAMLTVAANYVAQHGSIEIAPEGETAGESVARPRSPREMAGDVVTIESAWIDARTLAVRLQIATGFHINAFDAKEPLIPTGLNIPHAQIDAIKYPVGSEYAGSVTIRVQLGAPIEARVRAALTYQPCNENACLAPVAKSFDIEAPPSGKIK